MTSVAVPVTLLFNYYCGMTGSITTYPTSVNLINLPEVAGITSLLLPVVVGNAVVAMTDKPLQHGHSGNGRIETPSFLEHVILLYADALLTWVGRCCWSGNEKS